MTSLSQIVPNGAKFAAVVLDGFSDFPLAPVQVTAGTSLVPGKPIDLDSHWRDWLGEVSMEELGESNLSIVTFQSSDAPSIIDIETRRVESRVQLLYTAFLLVRWQHIRMRPFLISGYKDRDECITRSYARLNIPCSPLFVRTPTITSADLDQAAELARAFFRRYADWVATPLQARFWRYHRCVAAYVDARERRDPLDRLHQYVRVIEGLILPQQGKIKKQFMSRTEVFVGPRHHKMMGELYDYRSAVEHLADNAFLEMFTRDSHLRIRRYEAVAEYIARTALARIITSDDLWRYFASTDAMRKFWAFPSAERSRLFGPSINPEAPVIDHDPHWIRDTDLPPDESHDSPQSRQTGE